MLDARIIAYEEAWNTRDTATRRRLLDESLTPDAQLVDPVAGRIDGREAIHDRIAGSGDRFPGARVSITSGVDEHNQFARYEWAITSREGEKIAEGIDIIERATDGRIKRVIMFFGALPPPQTRSAAC